jgi:hypothetical protein
MALRYNLVNYGDQSNITVVLDGEMYVADNQHPNWNAIVKAVEAGDESNLEDLFDTQKAIDARFKRVSERVSVRGGKVLFDGDAVHNSLTDKIMRFLEEDVEDWQPLVAFMEKVYTNPSEHSRDQLFDFLARNEFSITPEGDIIGYKGLYSNGDGTFRSWHSGEAFVNGEFRNGQIHQTYGDVVEMPRSQVVFDPAQGCTVGLHVSNRRYATSYGDHVVTVLVNPRDVVSVPDHDNWQKVRVCRYTVLEDSEVELTDAVYEPKHRAPVFDVQPNPYVDATSAFDDDEESEDDWLSDDEDSWDSWDDDLDDDHVDSLMESDKDKRTYVWSDYWPF